MHATRDRLGSTNNLLDMSLLECYHFVRPVQGHPVMQHLLYGSKSCLYNPNTKTTEEGGSLRQPCAALAAGRVRAGS